MADDKLMRELVADEKQTSVSSSPTRGAWETDTDDSELEEYKQVAQVTSHISASWQKHVKCWSVSEEDTREEYCSTNGSVQPGDVLIQSTSAG
jgi:hypothetical protein